MFHVMTVHLNFAFMYCPNNSQLFFSRNKYILPSVVPHHSYFIAAIESLGHVNSDITVLDLSFLLRDAIA